MDISFLYTQKRKEFGKRCTFSEIGPHLLIDIEPDPELKKEFYQISSADREVDNTRKTCAHEVNTVSNPTESSGMSHSEGGWPAGVDTADEENMARFRKKIEKDKNYVYAIKALGDTIETFVMENNSIDIYQEYFGGKIVKQNDGTLFRTLNVFLDVNDVQRRIVDLSWSEDSSKIAAAYSVENIKNYFGDMCMDSYVWDIENSVYPLCVLKPQFALNCIEFSLKETNLLLGGYCNGQLALWDIRMGGKVNQLSSVQKSHSQKVTGLKWLETSSNMIFFSASTDGRVMSWDARNLFGPSQQILLNPEKGDIPNLEQLSTVSCVEYDPTVPDKFMLGTEQGQILTFSRKCQTISDSVKASFNSSSGPILKIERNAFFPKLFASCDPWSIKIWSDLTSESPVLNIISQDGYYTDFIWSPSRPSLLYLTKTAGTVEVWDIPGKHSQPMMNIQLAKDPLCTIASNYEGSQIACGSVSGSIQLLEVPEVFRKTSAIEINLVSSIIGGDEEIGEGQPRQKRLPRVQKTENVFKFEDLWDPPERAEDLLEEHNDMFLNFPPEDS